MLLKKYSVDRQRGKISGEKREMEGGVLVSTIPEIGQKVVAGTPLTAEESEQWERFRTAVHSSSEAAQTTTPAQADDEISKLREENESLRERNSELERQLATVRRGDQREPDPEFVALYNRMRDEGLKQIARQLPPVKRKLSADDWDRMINFNLAGLCGALLRGDSDDIKSEQDIIDKFLQQARHKAGLDREIVRRTSPTPAPAGASSSGQGFNLSE